MITVIIVDMEVKLIAKVMKGSGEYMTENKRFELDKHDCIYDNDSIAKDGGRETYWLIEYIQQKKLVEKMNKLADENKELKDKNSQLQETLAFRSNQLALMERLVDDLGSEEMARQMEEILND